MKNFLRLSLASLLVLFCGTIFAAEPYKVLTFPDDNSADNNIGSYEKTWTAKIGSDSWTIVNFNNNNWNNWSYIKCGRKNTASVASIATDAPIDQPIGSVVVTIDKISSKFVNSISLVVASDAAFDNVVETVPATDLVAGDMTFTVASPAANLYYKLVFDCNGEGSSNGPVQVSKVAYYKSGDAPVITDISNTPETAYTVAKAHELIEAGEGLATSVYVKGVVTEVGKYDSQYGQVSYYINDAEGAGEPLYIYGGLYLGGEKFTSADQIKVGDEVVVYGNLMEYNGTHEMNYGNYIYSLNGKTDIDTPDPGVDISNTPETAYTVAKAHELIEAGEGLSTQVYVKGIVSQIDEISTKFGNATYYINDVDDVDGQLQVYRGKYFGGENFTSEDQLKPGDEVIVYGTLVNFGGTTHEITGSQIYSINGNTGEEQPTEAVACENIAAVKAQPSGTLVSLTFTDAQVVYVNSYESNGYTNTEYFVRDASGAIDLYNTGLELKANDILNGVVTFSYSPYAGLPELVKADETNADNLVVTEGTEAQPVEVSVADLLTDKYMCDLVTVKNVGVVSAQSGTYTNYYAVDDADDRVMLYDKFKLNVNIPADEKKYDITGIMGSASLSGTLTNELFLLDITEHVSSGIDGVTAGEIDENAPVYNLSGQRVSKNTKGILIQNGKKFINK